MSEQKKSSSSVIEFIKSSLFNPIGICILVLVLLCQVLVVIHTQKVKFVSGPQKSLIRTNVTLKPLKLDKNKFEIHVLKPHNEMKKKFPSHPEMILKKLIKEIDKEGLK